MEKMLFSKKKDLGNLRWEDWNYIHFSKLIYTVIPIKITHVCAHIYTYTCKYMYICVHI